MALHGQSAPSSRRRIGSRTRRPRFTQRRNNQIGSATRAGVPFSTRGSPGRPGRATSSSAGCKYPRRLSVYPSRARPFDKFNDSPTPDGRSSQFQSDGPPGPIIFSPVRGFSRGTTLAKSDVQWSAGRASAAGGHPGAWNVAAAGPIRTRGVVAGAPDPHSAIGHRAVAPCTLVRPISAARFRGRGLSLGPCSIPARCTFWNRIPVRSADFVNGTGTCTPPWDRHFFGFGSRSDGMAECSASPNSRGICLR